MYRNIPLLLILLVSLLFSCNPEPEYSELVEREMEKGIRNDSLFLGYSFGMTRQEFFDHSWNLNSRKIVTDGTGGNTVRHEVDYLKYRAHKIFYPEFYREKIYKMPVRYMYNGWAPWNRDYWADSLKKDVLRRFKKRYSNKFLEMKHPELDVPAHIMVDKNKRIAIYELNDKEVAVDYTDLTVLNEIEKN